MLWAHIFNNICGLEKNTIIQHNNKINKFVKNLIPNFCLENIRVVLSKTTIVFTRKLRFPQRFSKLLKLSNTSMFKTLDSMFEAKGTGRNSWPSSDCCSAQ